MPNVKSQFDRYELLVALLKTKHTKKELLEKYFDNGFDVHWKTLNNDLTYLKDRNANIHIPDNSDPYYYFEDNYISEGSSFTDEDLEVLQQSVQILSNTIGFRTGKDLKEILLKSKYLKYHFKENQKPIISFEKHSVADGLKHLEDLYYAISNKNCLKITYTPYSTNIEEEYTISPYFLKEHRNRWYLLGLKNCDNFLMNMALDRISKIKLGGDEYIENSEYDFEEKYKHVVGVTIPMESEPVIIRALISKFSANYIKNKPIINNQKIIKENNDGSIEIEFKAYLNYELTQLLLSFGSAIKVLDPENLKVKMHNIYKDAIEQYSS